MFVPAVHYVPGPRGLKGRKAARTGRNASGPGDIWQGRIHFGSQVLYVCFFCKRWVRAVHSLIDAEMVCDQLDSAEGRGGLLLGKQVDLDIKVRTAISLAGHLDLTD